MDRLQCARCCEFCEEWYDDEDLDYDGEWVCFRCSHPTEQGDRNRARLFTTNLSVLRRLFDMELRLRKLESPET